MGVVFLYGLKCGWLDDHEYGFGGGYFGSCFWYLCLHCGIIDTVPIYLCNLLAFYSNRAFIPAILS